MENSMEICDETVIASSCLGKRLGFSSQGWDSSERPPKRIHETKLFDSTGYPITIGCQVEVVATPYPFQNYHFRGKPFLGSVLTVSSLDTNSIVLSGFGGFFPEGVCVLH